jgi:integrase
MEVMRQPALSNCVAHVRPSFYIKDTIRCADTIQELLGHKDIKTTMAYTPVLQHGGLVGRSRWMRDSLQAGNKATLL